jgi:aminoglycoside phosphotransferase (APT) family kinase protein
VSRPEGNRDEAQSAPAGTDAERTLPPGVDAERVGAWFGTNVAGVRPPLTFELIAGGRSNLTYRVADESGQLCVLRRPPLGGVLATAHDMGREHRIISALAPSDVPVPRAVAFCDDVAVNDAPFYVMELVEGQVWRDKTAAEHASVAARRRAAEDIADVLARIHLVDVDAVGLGDLGRKEDYIGRQLRRWSRQWSESKTRELPVVDDVHRTLVANIPEQGPATIVHGDYRLDNCLVGPDGAVRAVLDWELCTLGDPLADLGLLLVYWTEPGDTQAALGDSPTLLEGFGTRDELVKRYAEARQARSGGDGAGLDDALANIGYYVAFGYWKLACILEGVYARYRTGAMGAAEGYEIFARQVEFLAETARGTLDELN